MAWPPGALAVAIVVGLLYVILQIVALGQLTGQRKMTGIKYLGVVVLFALFLFVDWLLHAETWAAIEELVLAVAMPVAVIHLAVLIVQESRQT
jgi:hypothetical protein